MTLLKINDFFFKKKTTSINSPVMEQCFFCKKNPAKIYFALDVNLYGDQLQPGNLIVRENLKIKVPRCKKCMNRMKSSWPKIFKRKAYLLGIIASVSLYAYFFYHFFTLPRLLPKDNAFIIWLCPVTLIIGIALTDVLSGCIFLKNRKSFWSSIPDIKNFSKITKLIDQGWRLQR